jgi:branched-chain amino acid transport system substrate-binding protein
MMQDQAGQVRSAVCTVTSARDLAKAPHPELANTTTLIEPIIIAPGVSEATPATEGTAALRIGFLSDMPVGDSLGEYLDPIILALEDAMIEGRVDQSIEVVARHVIGLPTGSAADVINAYAELVALDCVLVLSTGVTNNALVLQPAIEESRVPYITMAGTTRFIGQYCFSLANGGHGEETAILASYLAQHGFTRVVVTGENSPGDAEYRQFFREQASLYGIEILDDCYFDQRPSDDELDRVLRHFRDDLDPDALVYCGFGINSAELNPSLARIGWNPPKIMNAAIMWAFISPEWTLALDGWIGIEQSIGDHENLPKNPNWVRLLDRHEARFGYRPDSTMVALLYDQGRAATEAIANATQIDGDGLALGLERIKMMPSTLGGPRTYIEFGPNNHRGYKGDFMFMKQLRDGLFHFASYHEPQWPSNHRRAVI